MTLHCVLRNADIRPYQLTVDDPYHYMFYVLRIADC